MHGRVDDARIFAPRALGMVPDAVPAEHVTTAHEDAGRSISVTNFACQQGEWRARTHMAPSVKEKLLKKKTQRLRQLGERVILTAVFRGVVADAGTAKTDVLPVALRPEDDEGALVLLHLVVVIYRARGAVARAQ